jgi:D-alanine transaminase
VKQVYVNGEYCPLAEAKISVFDRGFLFGDAVYEVLPVYNGQPAFVEQHLRRLYANLEKIKISPPKCNLYQIINDLIIKNGSGDLQVYIHITRGNQNLRKHDIPPELTPSVIAFTIHNKYPTLAEKEQGITATILNDMRWDRCDIKTTSLLANILLNDEALSNGYHTSILARNNIITEGSAANVFIVSSDRTIKTPPLNNFCLPGITREIAIQLIKQLEWNFAETEFSVNELLSADEIWITSTTKEIFPVTTVDNEIISNGIMGDYCRIINQRYTELVNK